MAAPPAGGDLDLHGMHFRQCLLALASTGRLVSVTKRFSAYNACAFTEFVMNMPPFFGEPGQPVPSVDPEDLKAVFELFEDTARQNPEGQVGVSVEIFKELCKPGADIAALAYRSMMLRLLAGPAPSKELEPHWKDALARWTHNGHLDAAVYREIARLPMEWMGVGVIRQGPPFDVESLLRRLSGEAK